MSILSVKHASGSGLAQEEPIQAVQAKILEGMFLINLFLNRF